MPVTSGTSWKSSSPPGKSLYFAVEASFYILRTGHQKQRSSSKDWAAGAETGSNINNRIGNSKQGWLFGVWSEKTFSVPIQTIMLYMLCEERLDPVDVVEGKSIGLGHSSDVGGAGQSIVEDYAQVPHSRWTNKLHNKGKIIHVMWLEILVIKSIVKTEVILILSLVGQFPESRVWTSSHSMSPKRWDLLGMM